MAGALMAVWSAVVEQDNPGLVDTSSYVDGRLTWTADVVVMRRAKSRSAEFDRAYGFRCDCSKCCFAHRSGSLEVATLAAEIGYDVADHLALLGLVIPLDVSCLPTLRSFELRQARRRLRLIGVAARGLEFKQRLMRTLVLPMLTWAGGFATLPDDGMAAVVADSRRLLHKDLSVDAPPVLTFEIGGWECHPGLARDLAAVRSVICMQCRVPVWIEEASIRLAS